MGRRTASSEPPHCQHTNLAAFGFTFPASVDDRIAMRGRLPGQAISTWSAGAKTAPPAPARELYRNHEAIALAGRMRLERLTVIVVDDASAAHGWPGGIEVRFRG